MRCLFRKSSKYTAMIVYSESVPTLQSMTGCAPFLILKLYSRMNSEYKTCDDVMSTKLEMCKGV